MPVRFFTQEIKARMISADDNYAYKNIHECNIDPLQSIKNYLKADIRCL